MKATIIKRTILFAAAFALSAGILAGCTSTPASNSNSTANANAAAATNTTNQNATQPAAKAESFDLTVAGLTNQDVKNAFNTDDKNRSCEIKMTGTYEAKARSNGETAHVVHLYIDGKDWKESIYCDLGGLTPPEDGAMVTATGVWKHTEGSQNDSAFTFYVSDIKAA